MGLATRLGPWLIGTVKNTIAPVTQANATVGLITNLGPCTAVQTRVINFNETTAQTVAFVIPAGSILLNAAGIITTTFVSASPTITLFARGTQITSAVTLTAGNFGQTAIALGANSAAGATLCANVGSTDALIAFSLSAAGQTAGVVTLWLEYAVRNPDGTYVPAPNQV
jgi:hypothetical protein